jgi:hypothetical protein
MVREKCKATGKSRFPTPGDAKEAMAALKSNVRYYSVTGKRVNRKAGKVKQCRYYYCCHCNGYHMTSNDTPLGQKKREKIFKQRIESTKTLVKNKQEAEEWRKDSLPFPETKINNDEMV